MGEASEKDVERLLRGGIKSDPGHKEALRARLFGETAELSLDDLAKVTGGAAPVVFQPWPEEHSGPGWPREP